MHLGDARYFSSSWETTHGSFTLVLSSYSLFSPINRNLQCSFTAKLHFQLFPLLHCVHLPLAVSRSATHSLLTLKGATPWRLQEKCLCPVWEYFGVCPDYRGASQWSSDLQQGGICGRRALIPYLFIIIWVKHLNPARLV